MDMTAGVMMTPAEAAEAPRILQLGAADLGPPARLHAALDRAARLGISHVLMPPPLAGDLRFCIADDGRAHPALGAGDDAAALVAQIARDARARGLCVLFDVMPDYVAAGGQIALSRPDVFRPPDPARALDPRSYAAEGDIAAARFDDAAPAVVAWFAERMRVWHKAGIAGFRLASLRMIPAAVLRALRSSLPQDCLLLGWTCGLSPERQSALAGCGLDFVFCSLPEWDFRQEWLWTEAARLRAIAPLIAPAATAERPGAIAADPLLRPLAAQRAARFAAAFGDGWMVPAWFADAALPPAPPLPTAPPPLLLSPPGAAVVAFLRARPGAETATLLLANAALDRPARPRLGTLPGGWETDTLPTSLDPGAVVTLTLRATPPITLARPALPRSAAAAARAARIAIEAVSPSVDGGRFAAKRIAGETVRVRADVLCDGHDQLAVMLLWRSADAAAWQQAPMRSLGNDRWEGSFALPRVGRWLFTIEAWRDSFASYCDELAKKHAAGIDLRLELIEGSALLAAAAPRVPELRPVLARLDAAAADAGQQVAILLAAETAALMRRADQRPFAVRLTPPCPLDADRPIAGFASWYELFPRSMSDDPARHGTFRDVIRHLPRVREMGFDVLYFPPIHPIGSSFRKGRNNSLAPAADDPGSPYAIGSAAGGHQAIHPQLGTLAEFHALRDAATAHGLELALDFAIHCAPDHPWLTEHPDWFDWRPDGSLRYAENPPKKYQDIVNVHFYATGAVPELWIALCEVVLYWAAQGIRIFRVDNPHTKPLPFWEWLIAEVRAACPDAIFLAEAFTRPKMMQRLGKVGFAQSYTYFTWRHTKAELTAYLEEISAPPVSDLMRPNFFVNTPDINPVFLQTSGRAGFLIRAALAALLAPLWGVYCGFELCESAALPGREEYADSEKYQIRAWDWQRPGNIVGDIAALNRIRRRNPALQRQSGLHFLTNTNDHVLTFEKANDDRRNVVLAAISLDPFATQTADIELPLWRWGLPDTATLLAEDLLSPATEPWPGKWRRVTLTPEAPCRIWRLHPAF